ncbi:MAG TPA: hypothetical protein VHS09_09165, partial [Polyangiaceae bacterium]|nr:hypothetical protein [Polyangiaceae bacterium]
LDDLSRLDVAELGRLYAHGAAPANLAVLEGHPRGRMLSVRGLDHGVPGTLLRRLAGADAFPWGGKSFAGAGESGTGLNRVHLGGRHQLFPFLTSLRPSVVDRAPCVVLDYDLADNPGFIRAIHDEVRAIEPGLFLGPAMLKAATGPKLVLWFALDTRVQAAAIGQP